MRRTDCPTCGAPIIVAPIAAGALADDTELAAEVIVDRHESTAGPDRYAIWDDGQARRVTNRAEVLAHPKHTCRERRRS